MGNDEILENKNRRLVLDLIMRNPGVTFQMLRRTSGVSPSTLRYHLDILGKNDLIIERKERNQRVYVSIEGSSGKDRISLIKERINESDRCVLELIGSHPGMGRKELMERSGENRRSLSVILHRLRKKGLIMKMEKSGSAGYRVMEQRKLHDEMVLILIEKYMLKEISLDELMEWKKKIDEMI